MYQQNCESSIQTIDNTESRKMKKHVKILLLLLSLCIISITAISGSLAYIATNTNRVENLFTPASVACFVETDATKGNVGAITNTGNVDAYIRASVVVNWMNPISGSVYALKPIYTVIENTTGGWKYNDTDGFYYYCKAGEEAVTPGTTISGPATVQLADDSVNPDGYTLAVEIVAEAIQAEGVDAYGKSPVELQWGAKAKELFGL